MQRVLSAEEKRGVRVPFFGKSTLTQLLTCSPTSVALACGFREVDVRSPTLVAIFSAIGFGSVCAACTLLQLLGVDRTFRTLLFLLASLGLIVGFVCAGVLAVKAVKSERRWFVVAGLVVALVTSWLLSVNLMRMIGGALDLEV